MTGSLPSRASARRRSLARSAPSSPASSSSSGWSQRGLGQRRRPPTFAPPQERTRACVRRRGQRQPGQLVPARRGQGAQLGAPQRGPMFVQRIQPAAAGVPTAGARRPARPDRGPRPATPSLGRAPRDGADSGPPRPGAPPCRPGRRRPRRGPRAARRPGRPPSAPPRASGPAVRRRRPARSVCTGQTPGRKHDELRPGCRHVPRLGDGSGARGTGRGQCGLSVAAGELGQRQEQLDVGPQHRLHPLDGPAGRRPPRTPRRAAQPPSAPGTGRARARRAGRPSARTRGRPRRTAGGPRAGHRVSKASDPWLCSARTASTSWPSDSKNRRASSRARMACSTLPTSR